MGDVESLIKDIPIAKIKHFAAEAKVLDASEINKFSVAKRYTLILSLIYMSKIKARDNLVEMFLKCLRKIQNKGKEELKKIQEKNRVKTENLISILTMYSRKQMIKLRPFIYAAFTLFGRPFQVILLGTQFVTLYSLIQQLLPRIKS